MDAIPWISWRSFFLSSSGSSPFPTRFTHSPRPVQAGRRPLRIRVGPLLRGRPGRLWVPVAAFEPGSGAEMVPVESLVAVDDSWVHSRTGVGSRLQRLGTSPGYEPQLKAKSRGIGYIGDYQTSNLSSRAWGR